MIVIGIDPGLTGALAFIDTAAGTVHIEDIPVKDRAVGGEVQRRVDGLALGLLVRRHVPVNRAACSVCENVRSFGRSGEQRPTTTDSLQRTLGAIEAVFDVLRFPCALVEPRAWQKFHGLAGKKAERARGELPAAMLKARELYPHAAHSLQRVKDHNRAEALLIAHFGASTLA